jgi:hypothetical protein
MGRGKAHSPEQIVSLLRQVEVAIANGKIHSVACREVLVLYLERPPSNRPQLDDFRGALLIQRLEGSRPHGRLCTLNRSEQVQRDRAPVELGRMCRFGGGMVR